MYSFLSIYISVFILKIFRVPIVREIHWRWFILAPIIFVMIKLVQPVIEFIIYLVVGIAGLYAICEIGLWIFK